jgi:hypothetical protein
MTFEKANSHMRKSKRLSKTSKKASQLDLIRMTTECYGTKEESVYPTSKKSGTSYFKKLMILLILFTPEAIRCIKISKFPTGGME